MIKHTIAALALTLLLAASAVQAQETNCDGWVSGGKIRKVFWEAATPETVADCLKSGSRVNARDNIGATALYIAAGFNENPEVLTVLLEAGADVNARTENGNTPLHYATSNKNLEVLAVLLDAGVDGNARDQFGRTPLHWAAFRNKDPEANSTAVKLIKQNKKVSSRCLIY